MINVKDVKSFLDVYGHVIRSGSLLENLGMKSEGAGIYIPGNVPSSKNSKRIVTSKSGTSLLIGSKQLMNYKKHSGIFWKMYKGSFREKLLNMNKNIPLFVEFTFIRKSKHKFDYINPAQTVQDLMTEYEWIEDDNSDIIVPYFGRYIYDPMMSGVFIRVFSNNVNNLINNIKQKQDEGKGIITGGLCGKARGQVLDQTRSGSVPSGSSRIEDGCRSADQEQQGDLVGREENPKDFYSGC